MSCQESRHNVIVLTIESKPLERSALVGEKLVVSLGDSLARASL